jgi:hypothetical protein
MRFRIIYFPSDSRSEDRLRPFEDTLSANQSRRAVPAKPDRRLQRASTASPC